MELYTNGIELIFIDNPTVSTPYIKKMLDIAKEQNIIARITLENTVKLLLMVELDRVRIGELLALKETDILKDKNNVYKIHICRQVVKKHDMSDINNIKGNIWTVADYTKSDCGDRYVPLTPKVQ